MNSSPSGAPKPTPGRTRTTRGPWPALCAATAVVLGPAAVTASALDQANAAPMHHTAETGEAGAYVPSGTGP
ncbi:hypothetical protein [Streptomyces sp. VMFN-G11Ma]|uniref:hypothetical protein n=1 Tax=Streptomyces sp. VMFN-G11Ma TaxID=2135609 RepID=UPI000D3C3973|nr:hypothetical protein [Streptomyces sp. VMFN-G11Ma]PTM83275.1 hypothetical protein C7821_1287 [Streptomyces sp. VMFN-G11Ma]